MKPSHAIQAMGTERLRICIAHNGQGYAQRPLCVGLCWAGVAYSCCCTTARLRIWSRPLLQGSGLLSVDKRDSEPGPAVCIWASAVRRSGHQCAYFVVHSAWLMKGAEQVQDNTEWAVDLRHPRWEW